MGTLNKGADMIIKINSFEISRLDPGDIVISEKGITRIKSGEILDLLLILKTVVDTDLKLSWVVKHIRNFGLPEEDTLKFLEAILSITKQPKRLPYEKIILVHDESADDDTLSILSSEISLPHLLINIRDYSTDLVSDRICLIVFMATHYNYEQQHSMFFSTAKKSPKSGIIISHYTPNSYRVSQPYFPEIGNSCHFCCTDRLLSYQTKEAGKNSWSQLLLFSKKTGANIPASSLSLLNRSMAMGILADRINLLTCHSLRKRHQDSVLSSASIIFRNGSIIEEVVPHWHLCRCIRSY
jgi:McbB family protein